MVQHAVMAGKIPIMLKQDCGGGVLLHPDKVIYYQTMERLISDVNCLLTNDKYRRQREEKLLGNVFDAEQFCSGLQMILESHKNPYRIDEEEIQLEKTRSLYASEVNLALCRKAITRDEHAKIRKFFPILNLKKICCLMGNRIFKGI